MLKIIGRPFRKTRMPAFCVVLIDIQQIVRDVVVGYINIFPAIAVNVRNGQPQPIALNVNAFCTGDVDELFFSCFHRHIPIQSIRCG